MKYFARKLKVADFPHNGAEAWGVLDGMGGFMACADEQTAVEEAARRNFAWSQVVENRLARLEKKADNIEAWAGRQDR